MVALPILDEHGDPVTGAADLDNEISKNNDAFADAGTEAEIGNGWYSVALTASDMTADIITGALKSSTADTVDTLYSLYPRKLVELTSGTSQGGAVGYITLAAAEIAYDGQYNGCLCVATIDGNVEARILQACTKSNQQCTVTPEWNVAPDADDTYKIYLPEGMEIPQTNVVALGDDEQSLTDLKDFADTGYDPTNHEARSNVTSKADRVWEYADTTGDWTTAGTWASGSEPTTNATAGIIIRSGVVVTVTTAINLGTFGEFYVEGSGAISINGSVAIGAIGRGWVITGVTSATISANYGRIVCLLSGSTVTNNSGTVDQNNGGTIGTNSFPGRVVVNEDTITSNYGVIEYNEGTVTNNYGIILHNVGTVTENKAGGVVNNYGGTIGTDNGHTWEGPPTAAAIVDEWETQSQADPTGFHVNVKEADGTPVELAAELDANVTKIGDDEQSLTDLKDFADTGYDPSTHKVQGVVTTDTNTDMRGTDGANTTVPDAAGVVAAALAALETHGDSTWSTADVSALATAAALAALETHGDSTWSTADVSALATAAALAALQTHGDSTWSTADVSALATAAALNAVGVLATAIEAKTTNLPAAPAATGDIPTAVENADALLKRALDQVEDDADDYSLATAVLAILNSIASGTTWTIKKTTGATKLTLTLSTDQNADPVTGAAPVS